MKLNDLKAGDDVILDDSFTCMSAGIRTVQRDINRNLFIDCDEGQHFLDGHEDETGDLIGISWPEESNT